MAPIIHCIRHAQGFHNLGIEFHSLQDPRLTPQGEEQCATLQATQFPDQSRISLVTASPLTRTLHTSFLTFRPALEARQTRILAIPDAQETSDYPCDTGSDLDVLRGSVTEQKWPVDLSLLTPQWNVKGMSTRYSPHSDAIKARARDARKLLREEARKMVKEGNEDCEIVLVSHGGYLHYFTDDWEGAASQSGTGWMNCETRAYVFEDLERDGDEDDARLTETMESRRSRGMETPMPGREEQEKLFEEAMQGWERQGLQRPDRLEVPEARTAMTEMNKVDGPEWEQELGVGREVKVAA